MSGDQPSRQNEQPAFVLHSYPFRETSVIIEAFTRDRGRVPLIARGARRPKSALRGMLLSFQPLLLSWSGRAELRVLHKAEWQGSYAPLRGLSLICGFYVNELLLRFLARDDPHEPLFAVYQKTLEALARQDDSAATLRRFEKHLLRELGYGVILDRDVGTGAPIAAETRYTYVVDRGPVARNDDDAANGVELIGQTLIDMQSDNYTTMATLQQSKALMRVLINHYLGDRALHTRQLLRDLRAL
ncbi:MAG TPA: DNA repair protein RecO [Burkholderiales bacterium]|nr:DNA repair protein RecO [Burkholderiales bacterium]